VSGQTGFRFRAQLLALGPAQPGGIEAVTVVQLQQRTQRVTATPGGGASAIASSQGPSG
jgi:hypothetical protein